MLLLCLPDPSWSDDDLISGYNSFIFRTYSNEIFSGTDVRRSIEKDHYTIYNQLTIRELKIYESEEYRIFAQGTGWLRHDFGDSTYLTRTEADLLFGSIQIDRGRTQDGFFRLGRIYNYQGLLHQRFDGAEVFYPFDNGIELNLYGGVRDYDYIEDMDESYLAGGRIGYRFNRRNTIGLSGLISHTENQWEEQKLGGDWYFTPVTWMDWSGTWGYDRLADELYEFQTQSLLRVSRDFDIRLGFDYIIPGLLIPKSSIFSVYSLAQEERFYTQLVYHPGTHWTFIGELSYINYENEGGMGGPNNFFTDLNALDGGYQWRYGGEIIYRHNPFDEIAFRFEQMLEGNYGYTVTDLIRQDFDFRDFNPLNPSPEDEGFVFGVYENGFSSFSLHHWHEWSRQFSHSFNFYYYLYDNPLYLHAQGDESFSTNLTLSFKPYPRWQVHVGGRYLDSLADREQFQFYLRVVNHF
jgi:hypothetical protein